MECRFFLKCEKKGRLVSRPQFAHQFCNPTQNYFFGAAFFLPKLVSTDAPMLASICLAASALAPVGCSSRYFWNASAVPGGATILSPCSVALPIMFTPFQ